MIIWGSLVVMICGMLVILGLNLEDNKIERELKSAANHYIENNNIKLSMASATIIYVKELVKDEYIEDSKKYDEKCIQSIIVSKGLILNDYTINKECKNEEVSE